MVIITKGFTHTILNPSIQLKNDGNIIRSRDSIDSPTSEYENWPIQSKDHNALATTLENWQNMVIFGNKNIENEYRNMSKQANLHEPTIN